MDDIFAVQDEISEAIATALDAAFSAGKTQKIDPSVYDLYLRAQMRARQGWTDPEKLAASIPDLETVTRLAPDFPDAWVSLADTRFRISTFMPYADRPPLVSRARVELSKGLATDSGAFAGAILQYFMFAPFGAYLQKKDLMRTISQNWPNNSETLGIQALHLESVCRHAEAVEVARAARDLDPKSELAQMTYGFALWRSGRFVEGRVQMEGVLREWPHNSHAASLLLAAYAHQQDWSAFDALIDPERLKRFPLYEFVGLLAIVEVIRNPSPENRQRLWDRIRTLSEATGHVNTSWMCWVAHLGFVNDIYELLDRTKLGPSGDPSDEMGIVAYSTLNLSPAAYPELSADPRFVKLCARLGLVEYWLATQTWPDLAETVPYDFRAECEKYRNYPKDKFFR